MSDYYLDKDTFVIENYDRQKPFASFLPGIAGVNGIPMWVYYTNRGQGIAGFGVENKDGSILDFVPANRAYQRTEMAGFRTFVKVNDQVHEIFSSYNRGCQRKMLIDNNGLGFVEENEELNLRVAVSYFTITEDNFPGLVRKLSLSSLNGEEIQVELLDGLNTLWPNGTNDFSIKNMSNLATAWFETYNMDHRLPFFRQRATSSDTAEVGVVEAGHFYASFMSESENPLPIIYDPDVIFGTNTSGTRPEVFEVKGLVDLLAEEQISANKIPCAYTAYEGMIGHETTIYSVIGLMKHVDTLNEKAQHFNVTYFEEQEKKAHALVDSLTKDIHGITAYPMFDAYAKQSYMDNFLRGGYPLVFEGKKEPIVYHVYSRIHGDMEREYNNFNVEPAYYSQGVGNFRDVNQNRRNDVFFVPESGDFSIRQFMEFIQYDGLNPLGVHGSVLSVEAEDIPKLLRNIQGDTTVIEEVLSGEFTPGRLLTVLDEHGLTLSVSRDTFIKQVMKVSTQEIKANYGHGYWVDHWTYNMDLVDNYRSIYPDYFETLMFDKPLRYFLSEATVLKRDDKTVLTDDGRVRQYEAVIEDEGRIERLQIQRGKTNWLRDVNGELVTSNLFEKLLSLVINKMVNMDPSGLGIMMNTDKPGWNDAMNGLPGLFGSGTSEVVELNRIVKLLIEMSANRTEIELPEEMTGLLVAYSKCLEDHSASRSSEFELYEKAQSLKEAFDEKLYEAISDIRMKLHMSTVHKSLMLIQSRLEEAIKRGIEIGEGILPSYYVHEALEYDLLDGKKHPINGMQNVRVKAFSYRALPYYLEAPARYLKQLEDKQAAKAMFDKIRTSAMYDEKLQMYITSESLEEESMEIGRARAFVPGWLERESVFMHMEYKYLLGLIKSGLYDEFFEAIRTALPPFMNPEVYGRSTLENCSFIASSVNPNPGNHGRGFVSRLTGTTSEMTTMWIKMMTGGHLFTLDQDELVFRLNPVLPSDFFKGEGMVECTILGQVKVTYQNLKKRATYGQQAVTPKHYKLTYQDGQVYEAHEIRGQHALDIREGAVQTIDVVLD